MTCKEYDRLFALRCRSKRGEYIPEEEHNFCIEMFEKYPEIYGKSEAKVFNATVPFGSDVRVEVETIELEDGVR